MALSTNDIATIRSTIAPLLGQKPWNVSLGVGSFVTLEFGQSIPDPKPGSPAHGEWHFWVYCCAWYLMHNNEMIAGSEDDHEKIGKIVKQLEGHTLTAIDITETSPSTVLRFSEGLDLYLSPVFSAGYEHWLLYMPNGKVLSFGPGTSWAIENRSEVPA
jgi:hypothetical protein